MKPILLILFSLSLMNHFVAARPFTASEERVYKTVDAEELTLHIFYPEGHTPDDDSPAIIFFHGGGWKKGSPKQFYAHCDYLAQRGIVAISAAYRLGDDDDTPQKCVQDGKSAMRWVRAHANELGIAPDKILAGGGSAGGHVAAATAIIDAYTDDNDDLSVSCQPVALILFNPVVDTSTQGYGYDRVKDYWESISPLHNVDGDVPPTIFFVGSADNVTRESSAREFERLMKEHGHRCDLFVYEGQPHGFFNHGKKPDYYTTTVAEMDNFLVSLGYLEPLPAESPAH